MTQLFHFQCSTTKKSFVKVLILKYRPASLSRFFIGYWILHEAGFLSGLYFFYKGLPLVELVAAGNKMYVLITFCLTMRF
ncbi:MAG: hypothetical protein JWR72_1267 [Flavisolibacter sp.]|jgi:hypothetical protein|nr:hypothetical protein [Flavisolibacter sp.]